MTYATPGTSRRTAPRVSTALTPALTRFAVFRAGTEVVRSWVADLPAHWNGTLLLYSHGFGPLTAADVPDPATSAALLARGYALAGSSYDPNGSMWALDSAVRDQFQALQAVEAGVLPGMPRRVLAVGTSMGGLISALEAQDVAGRIDGALTTCGIVAGAVNLNNYQLDGEYALAQLLLPGQQVQLVRFANAAGALTTAGILQAAAAQAQQTPGGRARLALAMAFINVPPWAAGQTVPPPASDPAGQLQPGRTPRGRPGDQPPGHHRPLGLRGGAGQPRAGSPRPRPGHGPVHQLPPRSPDRCQRNPATRGGTHPALGRPVDLGGLVRLVPVVSLRCALLKRPLMHPPGQVTGRKWLTGRIWYPRGYQILPVAAILPGNPGCRAPAGTTRLLSRDLRARPPGPGTIASAYADDQACTGMTADSEPMLMYLVKQVELAVRSRLDDLFRPIGLTALQYTALTVLERHPDLSSAQLARHSFVTAQSMADMITTLEGRGLIQRHRDRADRRRLVVALTADGRDLLDRYRDQIGALEAQMLAGLTKAEISSLRRSLHACHANLAGHRPS